MEFHGIAKDGRFSLSKAVHNELERREGRNVTLSIIYTKSQRSIRQNAYYWGVIIKTVVDHLAYMIDELNRLRYKQGLPPVKTEKPDAMQIHDKLKLMFLQKSVLVRRSVIDSNVKYDSPEDEIVSHVIPGSTKDLNTAETEIFFDKCRLWVAEEFQIIIMLPNEMDTEELAEIYNTSYAR